MDISASNDIIAKLLGAWSQEIGIFSILFRIFAAVILSSFIGFERAGKRHAAGLRTFIFVCLASCVTMILDLALPFSFTFLSAAAVVALAIISANSILFSSRNQIKGLTTSVGLWACGILGFAVGAGFYTVALVFFITYMCVLSLLPTAEVSLKNRSNHFEIHLELNDAKFLHNFVTTIRELGMKIDDIESNPAYANSGLSVYSIAVTIKSEELKKYKTHSEIIEALSTLEYVCHIEEMN